MLNAHGIKSYAAKPTAPRQETKPASKPHPEPQLTQTERQTTSPAYNLARLLKCTLTEDMRAKISAFSQTVREDAPNIHAMARERMRGIIKRLTGQDADPDKIYLNTFGNGQSSRTSFTGWEHTGRPISSVSLTDLLLQNFGADKQNLLSTDLNVYEGVYTKGADEKFYGAANEFKASVADLRDAIWKEDFQCRVLSKLRLFWENHKEKVAVLAKIQFATSAIEAAQQSRLSFSGLSMVMRGAGAGSDPLLAAIAAGVGTETNHDVKTLTFDINGYPASDIVRFVGPKGRTVLYIPGETPAFHEFENSKALELWVRREAGTPEKRARLEHHFSLYDLQDGLWYTGVENGLKKLGANQWLTGINSSSLPYSADPFADIVENMQRRSLSDADTLIKSDSEVTRDIWIGRLRAFNKVFWPILMLAPELEFATLAVTMGNEVGLEIDQAVSGDTYNDRKEGFYGAVSTGSMMMVGAALGAAGRSFEGAKASATGAAEEILVPPVEASTMEPPLKIGDISAHQVDASVIFGHEANGANIYQVKDRYYIFVKDEAGASSVYEIRSDFKLRDGYVNVIDPNTRRSVAIMHNDGSGDWKRIPAVGGGADRPPYIADRAEDVRRDLNRRGYVITNAPGEDADFNTIEKLKERVDALRFKLEDLGREPEQHGRLGNYRIVYRVDNVSPRILLRDKGFRPSKDFFAVSNLLDAPATIGSASLSANNNVLGIWQADPEDGVMYQYAIKLHRQKAASFVDGGGWDHEFLDEVHFPPPPANDVFLIDSSSDWVRLLIADIANSGRYNTSYGIPLKVFEDYRNGRISLRGSTLPELPRGSSVADAPSDPHDSLESLDTKTRGQKRTRDWVNASTPPPLHGTEPTPGPSRAFRPGTQQVATIDAHQPDAPSPVPPDYEDTVYERTQNWVDRGTTVPPEEAQLPTNALSNHEKTMNWISQNMLNAEMNNLVLKDRPAPSSERTREWIREYQQSGA
ncbi:DUF6543 domain-containing protein (plasmid) [Nitratireductor sp. GISD-1A_MAKvit]|uniref:dermonecrotic toxin domain-containing protein n=1 Tax=Nitratireductor sp. GISD-1A_MAKvit TaxID=3234198 RepID=UPI003466427B